MSSDPPTQSQPTAATEVKSVIVREMPADLETPVSAFLKLQDHGARLLLESVESGTILGRYSFIGIAPTTRVVVDEASVILYRSDGRQTFPHSRNGSRNGPLQPLKQLLQAVRLPKANGQVPLLGGLVGYIGYDIVRYFEPVTDGSVDTLGLPLALFYSIDTLLVFDHVQRRLQIMTLADDAHTDEAREKVNEVVKRLRGPLTISGTQVRPSSAKPTSNFTKDEFCKTVDRVKEHIRAGEVYQLVLSQRLAGKTAADPFTIYRALRMLNPSPYLFYFDFDDIKLIGSSPEALVRLNGRQATVRPIAGTRPRGATTADDARLEQELLADEKERAEHLMLVDLGRNDLGRCCRVGSVTVDEFMKVERYSHVMHITSNVVGELSETYDQFDLFRATFPAGTVTGAPKIRAMQLIEDLERQRRGPYAGAVGYFSHSGDMDWCIAIRTIIMKQHAYYLQGGAGIVADSVPEREHQETLNKIEALRKAIAVAEEGL